MDVHLGKLMDENGKIMRWPKKKTEKMEVLKYIKSKLKADTEYSEKEINEIINQWHSFGDHALIRREMYDNFLLERTPDGRKYWIAN
jgi:hypothetical protein